METLRDDEDEGYGRHAAPVKRLVAAGCTLTFAIGLICALVLIDSLKRDDEAASIESANLAATLASDIGRTVDTLDLTLQPARDNRVSGRTIWSRWRMPRFTRPRK